MNDAVPVGVVQRVADLARNAHRVAHRQRPLPGDARLQRLAIHERHHVPQESTGLARVVDRQDVRVAEPGGDADFAEEALGAEARGEFPVHHLERHEPVVLGVGGQEDRRHAPGAQQALDVIAPAKRLADALEVVHRRQTDGFKCFRRRGWCRVRTMTCSRPAS